MNQKDNKPVRRAVRTPEARAEKRAAASEAKKEKALTRAKRRTAAADKKIKTPKPTKKEENTAFSSLLKASIYIVFVLAVSAGLSYFIITAANDVFAFMKDEKEVTITTTGEEVTIEQLSEELEKEEVIRYPWLFRLYAKVRKKDTGLIATTETVSPSMSYDNLIAAFKKKKVPRAEIKVTIPEGYTVDDIIELMTVEYGIGTRKGFEEAINNYDYDYWFVEELTNLSPDRRYRLEGYLYPDTYIFYTDSAETTVVNKMLANFERKFDKRFRDRAAEMGWTVDDIIILASMIQMEGKFETEYGSISSVFHNRIKYPAQTLGKLESNATVQYFLPERMEHLTQKELDIDSPYNTHLYAGLPPGPISNPTTYAINYALYPNDTTYFYFVAKSDGKSLFASTYAEHLRNVETVKNEK